MSSNKGKIIANDFVNDDFITVPRVAVRAFIYKCVVVQKTINSLKNTNINIVMHHFKLDNKDRLKIKHMINKILHRANDKLPPINFGPDKIQKIHYNKSSEDQRKNQKKKRKSKIQIFFWRQTTTNLMIVDEK